MFKYKISSVLLFTCCLLIAQSNTEVFVMDLEFSENNFNIKKIKNISNNPGYDSQSFFINNEQIVYARTYNDQTDITKYNLKDDQIKAIAKNGGVIMVNFHCLKKDIFSFCVSFFCHL